MNRWEKLLWMFCIVLLFYITVVLPILMLFYDKPLVVHAADNHYGEPVRTESTAYCYGEITASGKPVREGIAAARKEWIGLTAVLYADDDGSIGELIGIYEILDTGGDKRIKNGTCIDVYMPEYEEAINYGRKTVWVQIVDAEG